MNENNQTLNFEDLLEIHPEHLWWEFSEQERETAWEQTAVNNYQNAAARHRAFVNCLCLNTFVKYLEDEPDLLAKFQIPTNIHLHGQWEFVSGIELTFNQTRVVLIPSEQGNIDEFRIPQEWVDIPNWATNYYLPVQINLTENWLRIWGFISYEQVSKKSKYDSLDRTYSVNKCDLIADINIMWVAEELCPFQKPQVKPLPSLSEVQAREAIAQLRKSIYSPRLDINFALWGAILADDEYRSILYNGIQSSQNNLMKNTDKIVQNLSLWFDNIFNAGFRSVDDLLTLTDARAYQFRSDSVLNEVCVKGAKLIDLGMQIENKSVALLIGLSPQIDNKVGIRVQLYPASGETYLPANIKLTLLSESGKTLHSVESRSYDNYIQLKRFKLTLGKHFSIQVALKDFQIMENFVLQDLACSEI
ncbi:DUF1822 family protein [Rivularia sp. UHCC 0363]|uniref:DUF1822 family protein n=1 Tax=Rivularia sp. UHCC 0363 TaxID=3110244 RepID=UPI002B205D90|nr:DUF1822 family protein [Rivularia sp. UHCC 0363]MEA5593310.1 DUF1822 family protein [Rivularia sp. UHCC 0363]